MGGTLVISEDAVWMPTGWVQNAVIDCITAELSVQQHNLIVLLERAKMTNEQYTDLSNLDTLEFAKVVQATYTAYDAAVQRGPTALYDPTGYSDLMFAFSQLKALLHTDPRNEEASQIQGSITFNDGLVWYTKDWILDLVLEGIEWKMRLNHPVIAKTAIESRTIAGTGQLDIRNFDDSEASYLVETFTWLFAHYGDGKGRLSVAPAFFSELGIAIADLYAKVKSHYKNKAHF